MAAASVGRAGQARGGAAVLAAVFDGGSGAHPYPGSAVLLAGPSATRNLADAVHCLCVVHGRQPSIVDHAAGRIVEAGARRWIEEAVEVFAGERALLTKLASVAGPQPSTPGHQASESALVAQRHAFETLARSERAGCPLGAALALAADWIAIRSVLDEAAKRFGLPVAPYRLRDRGRLEAFAEAAAGASAGAARALGFAAGQVVAQHHGLWDLLEARARARIV